MRDGFIEVAAITPKTRVGAVSFNADEILKRLKSADKKRRKISVFPALALTGSSCGDAFSAWLLIDASIEALKKLVRASRGRDTLYFVGLPFSYQGKTYNVAAVFQDGVVLGFIPQTKLNNDEKRYFASGENIDATVSFLGKEVPFSARLLLKCVNYPSLVIGTSVAEDLTAPKSAATSMALSGATVIVNLAASSEEANKPAKRKAFISTLSARLSCAYIYATSSIGESTSEVVYGGHNIIAEDGKILAEAPLFAEKTIATEIDLENLEERRKRRAFYETKETASYRVVPFVLRAEETKLTRKYEPRPFVPADKKELKKRCAEVFNIQVNGLIKRLKHVNCRDVILGLSGGSDSVLALLVIAEAFKRLKLDSQGIRCIAAPGFGTLERTARNAERLASLFVTSYEKIDIKDAVAAHLRDIGCDINNYDIVFENAQARERAQILLDLANKYNGIVVGTSDLSEIALGWTTYGGDMVSHYDVNCSVPKTLVKEIIRYRANTSRDKELKKVLFDVIDTPITPELLPSDGKKVVQLTEEAIGPYELHDFFLYYVFKYGYRPRKTYRLATYVFADKYEEDEIYKRLRTFYTRFIGQQFKRAALPDGPKVGSVSLSARYDYKIPGDLAVDLWMSELAALRR